jgi:hypothetical protein
MAPCWDSAESSLRILVAQKYPSPSEELITALFAGEFRTEIAKASSAGEVDGAFLADLRTAIPGLNLIARRASGLVARVNLPNRWHEGHVSAADISVVVTRPIVDLAFGGKRVEFHRNHATGLLAQAKLGRPAKRAEGTRIWNHMTGPQERLYPKRRKYYSLLLSRLNGPKANKLEAFRWQLCSDFTLKKVKSWLISDLFPDETSSSEVLTKLFARTIGTEDPNIIETIVDPGANDIHSIDLHIFWPDEGGPPPSIELHHQEHEVQKVQILQQ